MGTKPLRACPCCGEPGFSQASLGYHLSWAKCEGPAPEPAVKRCGCAHRCSDGCSSKMPCHQCGHIHTGPNGECEAEVGDD